MKVNQQLRNRVQKIGLILIMGISMSACSKSWEEEVLLHDGSKIIVQRSVNRGGRHEIGQQPPIKEQSLSFILPSTNKNVTWEDKFTEDIGGAHFLPMQLEILKNTAYLVAYPMGCLSYNKWGRPEPSLRHLQISRQVMESHYATRITIGVQNPKFDFFITR